ncbi:MAG: hypothetical protein LBH90_00580 [Tannerella sp.]|jgi:hypothetical protein|nr:hypothetical protein [Tannerella sp.]
MKISKIILILGVCFIPMTHLHAQGSDAFSSLGVSLSATTTGPEFEVITPLHKKVLLRGGISFFSYNISTSIDVQKFNGSDLDDENITVDMDGKLRLLNGKILADYFPSDRASFFVTGGLYFGRKELASIEGISDTNLYWNDYTLYSENGHVKAYVGIKSVKPYLGIGFGNAIPKRRVGFRFELGAMFHGAPSIYNSKDEKLDDLDVNDTDVINTINKVKVYPVIAFRLTGRIL